MVPGQVEVIATPVTGVAVVADPAKGRARVILGGLGNVAGAVLGATLLIALPEAFRFLAEYRILIYGIVLLLLIRFRPQGLMGAV